MNLDFVTNENDDRIYWSHRSQTATVAGILSVTGVMPFLLLAIAPFFSFFILLVVNLILDIIKIRLRVVRWQDLLRRFRFPINGGYWHTMSRNRLRTSRRSVARFPDDPIL